VNYVMAEGRASSLGTATRTGGRKRRTVRQESLSALAASYNKYLVAQRTVVPFFLDTRGNALPVKSTGHIHHPFNLSTASAWASLVDKLLDSCTFGLRKPLRALYDAYAVRSQGRSI
jgi:hypothetical protein